MAERITSPFGAKSTAREVVAGHDLSGKVAIVTGAATGIGVETARALALAGAEVIIAARKPDLGEEVANAINAEAGLKRASFGMVDLASLDSIRHFAHVWGDRPIDLLINNAGVMASPLMRTVDGFEMQFGTNHLGHFLLSTLLAPNLVAAVKASGKRDKVLILTKVAMWPKQPGLSAANIEAAVEGSLKRLQTDYIDLYQSHRDDADTPQDETLEAFDRLVRAGKVRAIGASNFSPERLASSLETSKAKGLARYETIQPKFNLVDRDQVEGAMTELTQAEGLGIIPFYGLAAGFLSGKYRTEDDFEGKARAATIRRDYWNDKGRAVLAALDEAAEAVGASQAQVALAWIMAHPAITAPLASATSVKQLDELMGAARLELPGEVWRRLDETGR